MKVYAPGLTVAVLDGVPTPPTVAGGSGAVTIYAPGYAVDVLNTAQAAGSVLHEQQMNMSRIVCCDEWHAGSRYSRFTRLTRWTGATATVRYVALDIAVGGAYIALAGQRYTLLIDGIERAAVDVAAGAKNATFALPLAGLAHGWHTLDIGGLTGGETCPTWFAFVDRGEGAVPLMPVCNGSYGLTHGVPGRYAWAWVPSEYTPTPKPLPPREYPFFDQPLPAKDLFLTRMIPGELGDLHRPNVSRDGIVNTFNRQSYFFNTDFHSQFPRTHLLDGPRGVGTCGMLTHISIGRATAEPPPIGGDPANNIHALDPWRLMRISDDGKITTLAGWRHRPLASHWEDEERPTLELVGDWSSIPPERHGFWETWGWAWDSATLFDHTEERLPEENNQRPHVGAGPAGFLSDSQHNRICHVQFDGRSHFTPAKVTEFLTGLQDPWDVVEWRNSIIVSERLSHRICEYDKMTATLVRVIIERDPSLPGTATVPVATRTPQRIGTLDQLQAQPCVAPEGLYILDDWLYFGSFAQAQVRRIHLETGALEIVQPAAQVDNNSRYLKIAVSDGTFGPRGTVFSASWSVAYTPNSGGVMPDGVKWKFTGTGPSVSQGRGNCGWVPSSYAAAVAVGYGRLYTASSDEGLFRYSKALPTDPTVNGAMYVAGEAEYLALGGRLLHGPLGYGSWGFPLPWGHSAALDYFLTLNGHANG